MLPAPPPSLATRCSVFVAFAGASADEAPVAFAVFSLALCVCIFCFTTALAASRSFCASVAAWKIAFRTVSVMLCPPSALVALLFLRLPAVGACLRLQKVRLRGAQGHASTSARTIRPGS
jgi:hypothetical protein